MCKGTIWELSKEIMNRWILKDLDVSMTNEKLMKEHLLLWPINMCKLKKCNDRLLLVKGRDCVKSGTH